MTPATAELARLSATELVTAYAARDLSPVDVVDAVAAVVEEREPTLNALWVSDLEAAREAARSSEQRWAARSPQGPLDGVPGTVKENLARAGVPMPSGCAGVEPVVPQRNSPVVDRITEAGGVIIGSTAVSYTHLTLPTKA